MAAALGAPSWAADGLEVTNLSIEDLMNIEVTSVSRKAERLTDAAAAAFVITSEDIQRSGAASVPEALRMVPGMNVARISTSRWAVSARGFNSRFANKLLVLVDGRSVYSPFFSGVFWESLDMPLEDIERIEVIRGPGATMWGANAVNGVINIVTRHARRTQGGMVSALGGNEGQVSTTLRWGGKIDEDTHYRVWGKGGHMSGGETVDGTRGADDTRTKRAGLRVDRDLSGTSRFMMTANVYDTRSGDEMLLASATAPYVQRTVSTQLNRGANVVANVEWSPKAGVQNTVQVSLDQYRENMENILLEDRSTFDVDFQSRMALSARQDLVWGLGYRHSEDALRSGMSVMTVTPDSQKQDTVSGFIHDEIRVIPDRWRVMLGSKFERNAFSGFNMQPNLRSLWSLNSTDSVWASVSRAVRTPSRVERGMSFDLGTLPPGAANNPLPVVVRAFSDASFGAESVVSYELGYRAQWASNLMADLTVFRSDYRNLRSATPAGYTMAMSGAQPYLVYNMQTINGVSARASGFEAALDWHAMPSWRLQTAYTYLYVKADENGVASGVSPTTISDGSVPRHQVSLRSSHDLGARQQLDAWLRRVGAIHGLGIGSYSELDLRWAWRVTPQLELSLTGQNLLHAQHTEYPSDPLPSVQMRIPRLYAVKARWQF